MARNSFHDQIGQQTPQHRNHFELFIEGVTGFTKDTEPLSMSLASVTLPKEETNVITLPYLNTELHYAGKTTVGQFSAEFYDFCDQPVWALLSQWRKLVFDQDTQKQGLSSQYKKTGTLYLCSPDFTTYVKSWSIIGIWPTSFDPGEAQMGSDEQVRISMSLAADRVKQLNGFSLT